MVCCRISYCLQKSYIWSLSMNAQYATGTSEINSHDVFCLVPTLQCQILRSKQIKFRGFASRYRAITMTLRCSGGSSGEFWPTGFPNVHLNRTPNVYQTGVLPCHPRQNFASADGNRARVLGLSSTTPYLAGYHDGHTTHSTLHTICVIVCTA